MAKKRKGKFVEWKVSVPMELALNIEYLLFNPLTDEPDYGARARLITDLLQSYWNSLPEDQRAKVKLGLVTNEQPMSNQ